MRIIHQFAIRASYKNHLNAPLKYINTHYKGKNIMKSKHPAFKNVPQDREEDKKFNYICRNSTEKINKYQTGNNKSQLPTDGNKYTTLVRDMFNNTTFGNKQQDETRRETHTRTGDMYVKPG